jgi:hypothetical protein
VSLICEYHHKAVQTWLQKRRKKKKRKRKKKEKRNYDQTHLKAFEVK